MYGGRPAPILFESLSCEVFTDSLNGPLEGELPNRLIDCRFAIGSFATMATSPTRLVGVRCDGKYIPSHLLLVTAHVYGAWKRGHLGSQGGRVNCTCLINCMCAGVS